VTLLNGLANLGLVLVIQVIVAIDTGKIILIRESILDVLNHLGGQAAPERDQYLKQSTPAIEARSDVETAGYSPVPPGPALEALPIDPGTNAELTLGNLNLLFDTLRALAASTALASNF
jgi:hypothetical protein